MKELSSITPTVCRILVDHSIYDLSKYLSKTIDGKYLDKNGEVVHISLSVSLKDGIPMYKLNIPTFIEAVAVFSMSDIPLAEEQILVLYDQKG